MPSTGVPTPNYGLNQWQGSDKPIREDFNSDNLKIDTALGDVDTQLANSMAILTAGLSRNNILHNWDFRNPVNQRGQTEYTSGYTIDRWMIGFTGTTVSLLPTGITIGGSGEWVVLHQPIEFFELYDGWILTLSVDWGGTIYSAHTAPIDISRDYQAVVVPIGNTGFALDLRIAPHFVPFVRISAQGPNTLTNIRRIKLEVGPISTLANDPPMDVAKELWVCQRYQQIIPNFASFPAGAGVANPVEIATTIPMTGRLRITPSVINLHSPRTDFTAHIRHATGILASIPVSILPINNSGNVAIRTSGLGSIPVGSVLVVNIHEHILLDANL